MARQPVTKYICDRCARTYQEPPSSNTAFDKAPPVIHLELNLPPPEGEKPGPAEVVSFSDLCPKCQGRVADLVKQIKLEKTDKEAEDSTTSAKPPQAKPDQPKSDKPLDATPKASDNKTKPTEAKSDAKVTTH